MGVLEFQTEMQHLRDSFESGLIRSEDQYEKMCIDNQRRNLSTLSCPSIDASSTPLNRLALQRLLLPVCVTLSVLAVVLLSMLGLIYEALSFEIIHARNETTLMMTTAEYGAHMEVNNKKQATRPISTRPLLYLSTNEGILSHLLQLQQLWSLTHMLNRPLAPVSFHSSSHFPEVEWVHLCDIFELPSDIICNCGTLPDGFAVHQPTKDKGFSDKNNQQSSLTSSTHQSWYGCTPPFISKNFKCTLMGSYVWAIDPRMYSLPHSHPISHSFDFETGECIAGHVDPKSGFVLANSTSLSSSNNNAGSVSGNLANVNVVNGGMVGQQPHVFAVKFAEKYAVLIRRARLGLTALAIARLRSNANSNSDGNSNSDSNSNSDANADSNAETEDKDRRSLLSSSDNDSSSDTEGGSTDSPATTSTSTSGSSSDSESGSTRSSSGGGGGRARSFATAHWPSDEYRSKSSDCSNAGGQGLGLGGGGGQGLAGGGGTVATTNTNGNSGNSGSNGNRAARSRSHRTRRRLNADKDKDKEAFSRGKGGAGGCITHIEFIEMIKAQGLGKKISGVRLPDNNNNKEEEDEKPPEAEIVEPETIDEGDQEEELIYVVTNEKNTTILSDFTASGLVLFSDLRMDNLTSLEISVVELGLVAISTRQLLFTSSSNYATFTTIVRNQQYQQFNDDR